MAPFSVVPNGNGCNTGADTRAFARPCSPRNPAEMVATLVRNLEPANSLRTVGTTECRVLHLVLPVWKDGRRDVLVSSNPMV